MHAIVLTPNPHVLVRYKPCVPFHSQATCSLSRVAVVRGVHATRLGLPPFYGSQSHSWIRSLRVCQRVPVMNHVYVSLLIHGRHARRPSSLSRANFTRSGSVSAQLCVCARVLMLYIASAPLLVHKH